MESHNHLIVCSLFELSSERGRRSEDAGLCGRADGENEVDPDRGLRLASSDHQSGGPFKFRNHR